MWLCDKITLYIDYFPMEVNLMSNVRRIFVEKKDGFNVEAKQILWDLRHNLGVRALTDLRFANRYDVDGLSDEEFATNNIRILKVKAKGRRVSSESPYDYIIYRKS